uniref:Uncharacterized protein n=1 Tax=viral metagenome TaxID=1070528 RepID=A0A6M3XJP0_9ZZZZ
MAITWGDYSTTRNIAITPADVQIGSLTAPTAGSIHSTSVIVTYTLTSDQSPGDPELVFYVEFDKQGYGIDAQTWVLADIQVEYSIDGASTYSVCTEDTVAFSALSEGTENLLTSVAGIVHNYVWGMRTDLGTNDYLTNVYVKLKAYDGASWSAYLASSAFTVDTVPVAPAYNSDSYTNGEKLKDITPEFHFTVPTDIGSDRLHFRIDWDTSSSFISSALVSRNSYDNNGFWHYHNNVDPSGGYTINNYKKYGDWYFQITGVTTGGNYNFGDYKDYYKDIYLPAEFIDPKVIIYSDKNILYYVSAISTTGFTVGMTTDSLFDDYSELTGATTTAILHTYVFEGIWGEYWVSDVVVSGTTKVITFGNGDFAVDDNGTTIPDTISTGSCIAFQSKSDVAFYINNIDASGFTINKSSGIGSSGSTDSLNLLIIKTATNVYYKKDVANDDLRVSGTDANGETFPSYIPGVQIMPVPKKKGLARLGTYDFLTTNWFESIPLLGFSMVTHSGETYSVEFNVPIFGCNADDFWVPIRSAGISEDYESEKAKFEVQMADALSSGNTYYYRVAAGNE